MKFYANTHYWKTIRTGVISWHIPKELLYDASQLVPIWKHHVNKFNQILYTTDLANSTKRLHEIDEKNHLN